MAFWEERALPSGVTAPVELAELAAEARFPAAVIGPRDLAPLARAAAIWRGDPGDFISGAIVAGSGRGLWLDFAKGLI